MELPIGENVGISEGGAIFTLEYDPQSASLANRGAPVLTADCVSAGARALNLTGVTPDEVRSLNGIKVLSHMAGVFENL